MKEVAERAEVSITTVSHVVNDTRYVAPETGQRVLEVNRHFAIIAGHRTLRSAVIRRNTFFEAVHAHNLRNCHVFEGNHRVDGAISAMQDLQFPREIHYRDSM